MLEKTWDDCRDDEQRILRIETKCAAYREFQADDEDVDAAPAFSFASCAAETYLPWAVERLRDQERRLGQLYGKRLGWVAFSLLEAMEQIAQPKGDSLQTVDAIRAAAAKAIDAIGGHARDQVKAVRSPRAKKSLTSLHRGAAGSARKRGPRR